MQDNSANLTLVTAKNLSYIADNRKLINNIDLTIHSNEVISLIGPNGAGKSTLVKLILGLLPITDGTITYKKDLIVSYVPQKFAVPMILPLQVVDLLAQVRDNRLTANQKAEVFETLNINPLLKNQVSTLSGGELQRVLLTKALLDRPELLILDEPMQGLDPEAQTLLYDLLDKLPEYLRCAMLVVSHDLHWVMKDAKRVICLNRHICCEGTPSHIATLPEFISLFGQYAIDSHQAPYIHNHNHCHHHT